MCVCLCACECVCVCVHVCARGIVCELCICMCVMISLTWHHTNISNIILITVINKLACPREKSRADYPSRCYSSRYSFAR